MLEYYWYRSGRQSRCNYYLCLIALEIFQLGQKISVGPNIWRSTSLLLSPSFVYKGVTFAAAADDDCYFFWYRFPFDVIPDYGRYFEIGFSVSPVHVEKDTSLIAWSRVRLFGQQRI